MQHPVKKILLVQRTMAYGTSSAQEALDVALLASTFEQQVSLLFVDDGVFLLKKNQKPEQLQLKNFTQAYKALTLYGIEKIYVAVESLQQRGLTAADLMIPVAVLDNAEVAKILQAQDAILTF